MRWIKNSFIVFIITLFSIKVCDYGIGVLLPSLKFGIKDRGIKRSINLKETNPNYFANLIPTKQYMKTTDSLIRQEYTIRTDENGFIHNGNPKIDKTNKKSVRIYFLGGSTTETLFVPEQQRFPSILERKLNKLGNQNLYKIYNGGVSGNHTMHSIFSLLAKVIDKQPDYVVLMNNNNDLGLLRLTGSYWTAPQKRKIVQIDYHNVWFLVKRQIKDIFIPNSYPLIKGFIGRDNNKDDFSKFRNKKIYDINKIEGQYISALKTFIYICRSWNIEPILMTQFNRVNLDDGHFQKTFNGPGVEKYVENYHRFNETIRKIGLEYDVDVIDLANLVPSTDQYIYDRIHLNETGSKLVAEILEKYFLKKFQ